MFILFINYFVAAQILYCHIDVDNIPKGYLQFQLFCDQTPQSCKHLIEMSQFNMKSITSQKIEIQGKNVNQSWKSEVNNLYSEFGAIGQKRDIEKGEVNQIYTIFLNKQEFDGPKSQWLVLGRIMRYEDRDLLNYIKWTAQSSNEIPNRDVRFTCKKT